VTVVAYESSTAKIGPDEMLDMEGVLWPAVIMTPGPPVWTAMFVCSQSISLAVLLVQNELEDRLVAGSAGLFTNWSDV